jgi:hypothetical protein
MFCRSLFVLLSFFFLPLCCLSSLIYGPITSLVSSNTSYVIYATVNNTKYHMNIYRNHLHKGESRLHMGTDCIDRWKYSYHRSFCLKVYHFQLQKISFFMVIGILWHRINHFFCDYSKLIYKRPFLPSCLYKIYCM